MTTGKALNGKPYAGNPHVRFDEGEVASAAMPRRGSLLYIRKVLAALAIVIEVIAMCGFVIPELALQSRSAFTQFFVMSSYVLLLKRTWCTVAGHKKPAKIETANDDAEIREQPTARTFNFGEFMRQHSSVFLIIGGVLAAMLILSNRYRLLTAGGTVYRLDRFSGRCEKVVNGMNGSRFIPIRESDEKIVRPSSASNSGRNFDLTKYLEQNGKRPQASGKEFSLAEFVDNLEAGNEKSRK